MEFIAGCAGNQRCGLPGHWTTERRDPLPVHVPALPCGLRGRPVAGWPGGPIRAREMVNARPIYGQAGTNSRGIDRLDSRIVRE
jgi:hypothetical protein